MKRGVLRISDWAGYVGPKLLPNGSKLWPTCTILEPSWVEVGIKCVQVGPKLGPYWPKLAPSGVDVAAMSDRNGAFGRLTDLSVSLTATTTPRRLKFGAGFNGNI